MFWSVYKHSTSTLYAGRWEVAWRVIWVNICDSENSFLCSIRHLKIYLGIFGTPWASSCPFLEHHGLHVVHYLFINSPGGLPLTTIDYEWRTLYLIKESLKYQSICFCLKSLHFVLCSRVQGTEWLEYTYISRQSAACFCKHLYLLLFSL